MDEITYTRSLTERFKRAVYSVICQSVKKKIARLRKSVKAGTNEKITYLEWRLAFNLYNGQRYERALDLLESVAIGSSLELPENSQTFVHPDSRVHLTAARCCISLYKKTKSHEYLKKSYPHYQNAVDKMEAFSSILVLPEVLYEFSIMLEEFGAFQAASDLHSRILNNFLNFKKYFDVMYRSAVVGKHIASLTENTNEQSDILMKITHSLQFLLEALPTTINEVSELFFFFYSYRLFLQIIPTECSSLIIFYAL
jgi:hypothetical protein